MLRGAYALAVALVLAPSAGLGETTLNKCIDARGFVTYTNKPCVNAREVRTLEIDPPPVVEVPQSGAGVAAYPPPVAPPALPDRERARGETRKAGRPPAPTGTSAGLCETLADQLGQVLDKMDQARRKGYTQEQMDKWNAESRALERKKQQSACF